MSRAARRKQAIARATSSGVAVSSFVAARVLLREARMLAPPRRPRRPGLRAD